MDAIYLFNRHASISYDLWQHMRAQLAWLEQHWQEPDAGIWDDRGTPRLFVHSRVMSWVAFDRAIRLARQRGFPAPIGAWERISAQIYEQVMTQGWSEQRKSFVQAYGSQEIDASALLMIPFKFAGPTDATMVQTVKRIQAELAKDALVARSSAQEVPGSAIHTEEDAFSACSFWLVECLARMGRLSEARLLLEKLLTYSSPVGLYAEKVGASGEALGNYPSAFTHLSLITACFRLNHALDAQRGRL
jgi:GH15 family glucan-1,4-alpha-glucosidase